MWGGIFLALIKKRLKMHGIEILRWNGFLRMPLFCSPPQLPPRAWDRGRNSGGLSDNCRWLEVTHSPRHFRHRPGVLPSLTMTAEAEGFLPLDGVWFGCWTRGGGRSSGRDQAREEGPAQALEQTASQNEGITGGLTAAHLTLKIHPKLQWERHIQSWCLLIVPLSTENWLGFLWVGFSRLPLCEKPCLFKYIDCTLCVHNVCISFVYFCPIL